MNKIIVIFGLVLVLIAGVAFYQFNAKTFTQPQMKPTKKVTIDKQTFNVEVVKDSKSQQIGLTKYNSIRDDQGMLFIFDRPDTYRFWMRGMKFPIDIIFINKDIVVSTATNVQPVKKDAKDIPIYEPTGPSDTVLEINAGLVKKYNIKKGDNVKIELK